MPDIYIDVCEDGTEVRCSPSVAAVWFSNGAIVEIPTGANCVRACLSADGVPMAIVAGQDDQAYFVNATADMFWNLGPCYGRQSVAINTSHWAAVRSAFEYTRDWGVFPLPPDQLGTSIGMVDLFGDQPQWTAEGPNAYPREITVGGVRLRYWVQRGDTYLGLLLGGEDQVVLVDSTGPHTLFRGLAHEPHLTVLQNGQLAASFRINADSGGGTGVVVGPSWPAYIEPPPVVPTLPRPVWTGYFYAYSDRYGDNPSAPGTASVVVEPSAAQRCPLPQVAPYWAESLGIDPLVVWTAGGDLPTLEESLDEASETLRPRLAYLDTRVWSGKPSALRTGDWLGLQCYIDIGETIPQFTTSIRKELTKLSAWGHPIALIAQAYDRLGQTPDDILLNLQPLWSEFARAFPAVKAIFWFSDGRPSGTRDHEELRPWHRATVLASPGVPPVDDDIEDLPDENPDNPEEPFPMKAALTETVIAFPDENFNKPTETRRADAIQAWETVEIVKNSDGTYSIKNGKGDQWLSVQPDGSLQSRPTSDPSQPGPWEKFVAGKGCLIEAAKPTSTLPPGTVINRKPRSFAPIPLSTAGAATAPKPLFVSGLQILEKE